MNQQRITNALLFLIFLCLAVLVLRRGPAHEAYAQPLLPSSPSTSIDKCITVDAGERPQAYLHVIAHQPSVQSSADFKSFR